MTKKIYKNDKFKSVFFFLMYLFTSMPALQFSLIGNYNIFFLIIGYGLLLIAAIKYKINFINRHLFFVFFIIALWTSTQMLIHGAYFRLSPFIILEVLSAYIIISVYGASIPRRFEDVTYYLCIIAIIGWILYVALTPVVKQLVLLLGIEADGEKSASLILYTVNMTDSIRNCGFAWEPGRTACMVCVAILFYLMRTRCNFRSYRFWIMTFCLVTTFSTTGFCVYVVVIAICYKAFHKISIVHLSLVGIIGISLFSLPFIGEKIITLMEQANSDGMEDISSKLNWDNENKSDEERDFYVPQRFEGLMFSVMNVINTNYFIGDGRDFQNFYINRILNWKVKTSEGILEIIVRYGIIIGLLCYYLLYRSSMGISSYFNVRNRWMFFLVFILINISYNFWEVPVFMAMWMHPIFISTEKRCSSNRRNLIIDSRYNQSSNIPA